MDMFNNKQESIFNFGIDYTARSYLLEAARWGKFLAIVGFILIGLMALGFVAIMFNAADIGNQFGALYGLGYGAGILIFYGLMFALFFYLNWTLYKFSVKTKLALASLNQEQFNEGLRNLKNMFKIWGICMIVLLAIYGIIILFALVAAIASGL
jgi:hypothetical protein